MIITILITITNTIERCARSSKKKTNKNMTKKSVAFHNHSFLITMFDFFFLNEYQVQRSDSRTVTLHCPVSR